MRKFLLLVFLVGIFLIGAGQGVDSSSPKFIYCELVGISNFMHSKVSIEIDYGQERGFFTDLRLRDEQNGKLAKFNSMVDALNYMGLSGWEFVQAYTVSAGNQNVYRWLLKKKKL